MQWKYVTSSAIVAVAYAESEQTLFVEFPGGAVYAYADVPSAEVRAFLSAESVGAFFNREIKTQYAYRKVEV